MSSWDDGLGAPYSFSSAQRWGGTAAALYRVPNQAVERATPDLTPGNRR